MTPCSSPVRDVSNQEDCPESTTAPEDRQQKQQQKQAEENDELQRIDRLADQLSTHGQVAHTVAELEGLSLDINTFTKGKSEVVEAVSDDEPKDAGPEPPVSSFDDSEGGSQSSSEESWASFPSSGSNSIDSSSDTEEEGEERSKPGAVVGASLPSPEATFKFHEEFEGEGDAGDDTDGPAPPPSGEESTMDEEDAAYPIDTDPWSSRAIPKWAFLRSSNSLPVLGLGPEDFYHGGSALRHEVSAEDDEEDRKSNRWSKEVATVGVVYL